MKGVDTIARVRRAFYVQGWSMKRIVRDLHVSRNTVRRILQTDETDFSYERERQPMPRIGPWQGQLEQFLSSNANKPAQERLTLIRIFEELRDLVPVLDDVRAKGHVSLRAIAAELTARGIRTRHGGNWQVSNVRNLLGRM